MKDSFRRLSRFAFALVTVLAAHLVAAGVALAVVTPEAAEQALFGKADPRVQAAMAAQDRHADFILGQPGVVGTATGLARDGRPAVLVLVESFEAARPAFIPGALDGVPVVVIVTGEIKALAKGGQPGPPGSGDRCSADPTARYVRPVPIGVSTGHPDITAGTIGARVTDSADVYALSNNHVYADENRASFGNNALQPGSYDGGKDPADAIGTLDDFEPICFSAVQAGCNDGGTNDVNKNTIDAAIALSTTAELGNATPCADYGTPKSATAEPALNLNVMKYGRTTGLTKGRITGINAAVNVGYDTGTARFVGQIIIQPGSFSAGGDSGSLIVVQKGADARKPVGLLFAGSPQITIANPIGAVLQRFDVTIDGE
jgi:hypothetical protein